MRGPVFRVEVAGHWQPDLRLVACEQRAGGVPRVHLALDVGQSPRGGPRRLPESALLAIGPTDLVTIDLVRGGSLVWRGGGSVRLFEGYVDGPTFSYSAEAETAEFWAVDRGESLLAQPVSGQYVERQGGDPLWLSGLDLTFNPDGLATMSAAPCTPGGGRARRVFTAPGGEQAQAWTAAEAANYLIATYASAEWLLLPALAELRRLFGTEVLENVRVEGRTVLAALEQLGRRAGLRATVALTQNASGLLVRSLVFVARGLGRTVSLYHQMPGETFAPTLTTMESCAVEVSWSESPALLELAGDVKLYEATFDLVPGWNPALQGQDRQAYRRGDNPGFADVADVYRKWVLNEAGDYTGEPYNAGPAFDFSDIFGHADYLVRRRRLLPTVSCNAAGESYGVYVELSYDDGETYARYVGPVAVLRDECGVYLASDQLPPALFHAADRDHLKLRVTATVESDARLGVVVQRPGAASDQRGRRLWLDVSKDFRFRTVHSSSIFHGGPSREVDDSEQLIDFAASLWQADHWAPTPGRAGLPFFSLAYQVGDRVDGVRYRSARLKRSQGGVETDPMIEAVRQTFTTEGWRTELVLL
jgi:hypothetical protein